MESPNDPVVLKSKDFRVELFAGEKHLVALSELVSHWAYVPAYVNEAGEQVDPVVQIAHTMTAAAAQDFMELTRSTNLSINVVMVNSQGEEVCEHHFTANDITVVPDALSYALKDDLSSTLNLTVDGEEFFVPIGYEPPEDEEEDDDDDGEDEDDDLDEEPPESDDEADE